MISINVRSMRGQISKILDRVQAGEEVVIVRRGQPAARIIPPTSGTVRFERHSELREQLPPMHESSGEFTRRLREDERY
ncbi:type II toxin-antitoxin system prevent-host-death family antitoxin [Aquisalimonas sp. 2447]|uniref:type II toxin-antitoxin system Phd/YefM family antitoxin n=1 Tax=Aquisalimonas sp. 2447 TaxID=2740807 RepID=UPI0014325A4D|nr:type II toxin-antitoxin system prevent-host-death family antitoxin [Aquisalimonas sp. 2447]QIT55926.1 type II toxin-antitoxin system prevent-host-death family antitoxin [Aquisalimonas sp. 2447]